MGGDPRAQQTQSFTWNHLLFWPHIAIQQLVEQFESLLSDLAIPWYCTFLLTGNINMDLLRLDNPDARKYTDLLSAMNLRQIFTKATCTTSVSETLIDHIISHSHLLNMEVNPHIEGLNIIFICKMQYAVISNFLMIQFN